MKKLTFTLFIALAVACLFSVPCNAKGKAKHVVFIGLDGWGAYNEALRLPNFSHVY